MKLRLVLSGLALALLALYLANASWMARPQGRLTILAHRGVSQTFPHDGVDDATCTATRIRTPTHGFLENTLPSMRRAFELGADVVEIDVHPTTDGEFVVFHDWTVDCRTDGKGPTRKKTLAELRALDIGYGYTADGGKTYPFRGKGHGPMPTLAEVLAAFPAGRFMINVKSNDPAEGEALARYVARTAPGTEPRLVVFGGWKPVERVRAVNPQLRAFHKGQFKDCMVGYLATGWFGRVPDECRGTMVFVPQKQGWLLWGWPNRFLVRMQKAGAEVYIAGDAQLTGRQSLHGLDDPERAKKIPRGWKGGVSTDRVELIGPVLKP
ncbi:glycerophosphodiester phosphodiesterase family protein [Phenylobacterium sp.]|jgi:glycerophosphoryl diester phosphodiesterase|uniref:glycerophosphodiester phosphodiesterase family protein n=1 Tax=Phenylobacterium sp. TaxID=1871053 RepID=UPI002F956DBE